ncbi:unnamed protein product [Meloidogyne enterolobii]|uniref:Uncharacterized protein n=2 Tax=Meloidogyne enterolobii TaxID=390850 RepID=A0A6V7VDQ2_MELEN|nr:unnamed protein product [Meloidogyne enterolobii]CAD2172454.1 unnamed protein product [Meloidogyne enterolobii]
MGNCCADCCLFLVMLIFPPLAVLIREGCTIHLLLNFLLTCALWLPGLIHAIYVCYYMYPTNVAVVAVPQQTVTTVHYGAN